MDEKFELIHFLRVIKERRFIIMLGTIAFLLFAKVTTDRMPPKYESSVKIMISQGQVSSPDEAVDASYQALLISERLVMTLSEVLTSRTLAERVIKKLDLPTVPEDIQERTSAVVVPDTQIIELTVADANAHLAQKLANAYAAEFTKMATEVTPASALINVRVVDNAALPREPVSPKPLLNLMVASLAGLLLSTGFAFLLGMLDVTVKETEEMESLLGLPSVGRVPNVKKPLLFGNHDSVVAEAYRSIRTNLQYMNFDQSIKTLLVSSPSVGEGKTTVVSNLAVVFAKAGHNVLVIDADLRNPRLSKLYGKADGDGLSNILIGAVEARRVIQDTDVNGLHIVTSGPIPPNPADLLSSERMDNLLSLVEESFDVIIIDCPPVLALADTPILASKASAILLVSSFRRTRKSEMAAAKATLNKIGARIAGFVLNGVEINTETKHYHYQRSYTVKKAA